MQTKYLILKQQVTASSNKWVIIRVFLDGFNQDFYSVCYPLGHILTKYQKRTIAISCETREFGFKPFAVNVG